MQESKGKGLVRSFGLGMAIVIVISSIVGSGVFKKVAPMAEKLGSPTLVMVAWAFAGLVILCGIMSVAELSSIYPDSGGAYSWLGKIYGKIPSFLYGWSCFTVIETAAIASVAYVFAGAVNTFIPLPHLSPALEQTSFLGIHFLDNIGAKIVTSAVIIGLTIVNIRGTKSGGLVSKILTLAIVICIAAIIATSFGSSVGSWHTFETTSSTYPDGGFAIMALVSVMILATRDAFWAFEGWIAMGFIGEEVKNPQKNMPKAFIYGILAVIVIYLLINCAYLYVMPIDEMIKGMQDKNNIAAVLVVDKIFGDGGAYIISGIILLSTFSCTNATILVSPRIYYAMAKHKRFFKSAKDTHNKYNTPHKALIYQCVWAVILTFSGSFDILTDLVIIAAFIFYGLIVGGVVVLRIKKPTIDRPYKTFGYPVVPIFFTIFCLVFLVISFTESPGKSLVGVALILSGLPFYFYWKNKHKKEDLALTSSAEKPEKPAE